MKDGIVECLAFRLAVLSAVIIVSRCERDRELYCGACIALAEELNWQTGITDPRKKVEVGGYRIDSEGNLHQEMVPLITSEIHLTEIFERVCRSMWSYVKSVEPGGATTFIPKRSREGVPISVKFSLESDEMKRELQFICDTLLEENEDWLLKRYQAKDQEVVEKLCVDKTGFCTGKNVTDQTWAYAGAVMLGLSEGNVPPPLDDEESAWEALNNKSTDATSDSENDKVDSASENSNESVNLQEQSDESQKSEL